jgi:hypothetical protein
MQQTLVQASGIKPALKLVVSKREVLDDLHVKMPAKVQGIVELVHFAGASSIVNLLRLNIPFREELTQLCALKNPSIDKLEVIGCILLGIWDGTEKKDVPLSKIREKIAATKLNYIKGSSNNIISQKLKNIFHSIGGFTYTVSDGIIEWIYNKTDSGTLLHRIGTKEFEQWENDVFNADIKTFEQLESFLSA